MFDPYLLRWSLVPDGDPITTPAARLLPVPLREPDAAKHGGILARRGRTARPRPQRAVAMTVLFVQNIPTA